MSMTSTLRSTLNNLLAIDAELQEREAALAAASELCSTDARVRAAYHDGRSDERARILTLLQAQTDTLDEAGLSFAVLSTLRRAIEDHQ